MQFLNKNSNNIESTKKTRLSLIIKIIVGILFLLLFIVNSETILDTHISKEEIIKIAMIAFLYVCGVILILVRINFSSKINRIISVFYGISAPFYIYISMEIAAHNRNLLKIAPKYILYNLLIIAVLELFFIAMSNRIKTGVIICSVVCTLFALLNYYVYLFRGIPVLASDIATISTALGVASNYKLTIDFVTYLILLALFLFVLFGTAIKEEKLFKCKTGRIGFLVISIGCIGFLFHQFVKTDYLEKNGVVLRMFNPRDSYKKYGNMIIFTQSIRYASPEKPEEYSVEKIHEISERYVSDTVKKDKETPNVIVVINEAFSDLDILGEFETNEDYMPFIRGLSENCVKGTAYASIIGGQTANTEFEFFTNNSMAFLPSQSVAFQLYIKEKLPTIVYSLKDAGYIGNEAVHYHKKENYQRNKVYPLLGFDGFYDVTSSEIPLEKIRKYVSDECTYDSIIYNYEKHRKESEEPYFGYTLTIQNHSPFEGEYDNFEQRIYLENTDTTAADLEHYLSLIKYSDEAFEGLISYFEEIEEPTIVFMVGDHQPRLTNEALKIVTNGKYNSWSDEEMMKRYAVPFVIWANYDIEEKEIEKTSMNYLQTILLETAGLELTGYQKFLQDMRKEVPVLTSNGYWGGDGKFYSLEDETSPYYNLLQDYAIVQYNSIMDSKNRVDDFFYLKK